MHSQHTLKKRLYTWIFLVRSKNTHTVSMIKIQMTICIHKKLHSNLLINISIQIFSRITMSPYHMSDAKPNIHHKVEEFFIPRM